MNQTQESTTQLEKQSSLGDIFFKNKKALLFTSFIIFCLFLSLFILLFFLHSKKETTKKIDTGIQKSFKGLACDNQVYKDLLKAINNKDTVCILNLSDNSLSSFPTLIFKLDKLQTLYLSENNISEIPKEIAYLKNLRELYLYGNRIEKIPQEICQLTELTKLDLSRNRLSSPLGGLSCLGNLKELYLYGNKIGTVSPEIGRLSNLNVLNLSYNNISTFPAEIAQLKKLSHLYVIDDPLTEGEEEKISNLLPSTNIYFR